MPSTGVIQLTLTLKMTTAQVVEMSVTVNKNSPIQDYIHPDDHTQPTLEMTPGLKPFTETCRWAKIRSTCNWSFISAWCKNVQNWYKNSHLIPCITIIITHSNGRYHKCIFAIYNLHQKSLKHLQCIHIPFPMQCWDVIAKLHDYNNIAKGREEMKGSRILQSVSRFLSELVNGHGNSHPVNLELSFSWEWIRCWKSSIFLWLWC